MIGLMLALMAVAPAPQAVPATLESCALEQGRWVCRYTVPSIEIIPFTGPGPGSDIEVTTRATPDATTVPAAMPPETAPPIADAVPSESGILTEREARLVARCADAGWVSLCLPDDRRAARSLRDRQVAYQTVHRSVTGMLAEDRCDDAVRAALDGGYMGLAREARDFCAASVSEPVNVQAVVPPAS